MTFHAMLKFYYFSTVNSMFESEQCGSKNEIDLLRFVMHVYKYNSLLASE